MITRASSILCLGVLSAAFAVQACSSHDTSDPGEELTTAATGGEGAAGGAGTTTTASTGQGAGFVGTGVGGGGPQGSGGAGGGDGGACGSVGFNQQIVPGNIIVVFDQSNSMDKPFTDGGQTTKWQVAEASLVAGVSPIEDLLNVGAVFFPTSDCAVAPITDPSQLAVEGASSFLTDFQAHFSDPNWVTIGSTPLADALTAADAAFPDPSPMQGQRAVVVLTDGKPTCGEVDDDVLAPVQAMAARGIKTYAIGLPGAAADAATLLDSLAAAGGTGAYIDPASPADLETALATIASMTLDQCVFSLDPAPADPSLVHLIVTDPTHPDGYEIQPGTSSDGWSLSADGKTATLLGSVCDDATDGTFTTVTFVYGCPVLPPH
jgi:hypothetical protein